MKTRKEIIEWASKIDEKFADKKTKYGAYKDGIDWIVNLWHPLAKNVNIIIFDKFNSQKEIKRLKGNYQKPNWSWKFSEDMDGYFYQYEITQEDGRITIALDPFAKSMAAFDWEGKVTNVGKAAFVDVEYIKELNQLKKINNPQPIIYEAHIRDLTSLRNDVSIPGSFNAIKEARIAEHIKDLGFNTMQFLPIHNCYSLNEKNKTILYKGKGRGWTTNYNWGYDPHNFFSINGWYSSDPENPYSRIKEFKSVVEYMHLNNINVVLDVVYNHVMTNKIFDDVIPDYYFRCGSDSKNIVTPVEDAPFASDRIMARRVIIDSLKWFVNVYDVDGFRFDLSCFIDKETLYELTYELRKIKPNIILHGEGWKLTDLALEDSLIKGISDNDIDFAYFNDSTRNAIKGEDDDEDFESGIIGGNVDKYFGKYLASTIGNIKVFQNEPSDMAQDSYSRFTNNPNINLQYASCHDGHTLWDKVNLTVKGSKERKFEALRQTLLMQIATQGRLLFLAGTEMLYTKPNDSSGQDSNRYHESEYTVDIFSLGSKYNENSYKTTDYTNGMRWDNLSLEIKKKIYDFMKKSLDFRAKTRFFNLGTSGEIQKSIKFNYVSQAKGIIDFSIEVNNKKVRVIHNFKENNYKYISNGKIFLDSKLEWSPIGICKGNSSQIISEDKKG